MSNPLAKSATPDEVDLTDAFARTCDERDELHGFREDFHLPRARSGEPLTYLCGHSLGLQPRGTRARVERELEAWATFGVEGHFRDPEGWFDAHRSPSAQMARIVGAKTEEVVLMNSLTVNLHLMLETFYRPSGRRRRILIEADAFSSDRYAVVSHLQRHGLSEEEGLRTLQPHEDGETVIEAEGESIALVFLPGVQYRSGARFDLARVTAAAHSRGALAGFDLAHAVGAVDLALHDSDADFAVWCTYKYLSGGPGSIGGCFVHARHTSRRELPRMAGWWGHVAHGRFGTMPHFEPTATAEGWQVSNPPILQLAAVRASLDLFSRAGMDAVTCKTEVLTGYLAFAITELCGSRVKIISPHAAANRGAHLALEVERSSHVLASLGAAGIVCDERPPSLIRVSMSSLYNTWSEALSFARTLRRICA